VAQRIFGRQRNLTFPPAIQQENKDGSRWRWEISPNFKIYMRNIKPTLTLLGFRSGVAEVFCLPEYDVESMCNRFQTFRQKLMV
jgi:hypothetical protein